MKKLLIYLSIFLNVILIVFIYRNYISQITPRIYGFNSVDQLLFSFDGSSPDKISEEKIKKIGERNNTDPTTVNEAKKHVRKFVSDLFACRSDVITGKERSVYFQLPLIIACLDTINKKYFHDTDYTRYGLRIYFGKYEANTTAFGKDYSKRLTTAMALTRDSLNLDENSYYLDNSNLFKIPVLFNLGGLCPPNCPTGYDTNDPLYHGQ